MPGSPVGTLADIIDWVGHYRPEHPDLIPAVLRVHPQVYEHLFAEAAAWGSGYIGTPGSQLLGLAVETDWRLAVPAWRVSTADGTLLHDSRSGKKGL